MIDQLYKVMKSMDTTIVLSTHVVDEIRRLADYVILIHHGKPLGMVEKDSALDNWKECWIQGDASIVEEPPGILSYKQETATTISFITTECLEVEKILQSAGIPFIQTRSWSWMKCFDYGLTETFLPTCRTRIERDFTICNACN